MKRYTFEVVITEGNDEFWEGLEGSGCDVVKETLVDILSEYGFTEEECKVTLKTFEAI
jgi:hypothetical protein